MSWCPNCKTEYREGITSCSDCGSALVPELPSEEANVVLAEFEPEKQEVALNFVEFLKAEAVEGIKVETDEAGSIKISVPESGSIRAHKIFAVFSKIEGEREFSALTQEEKLQKIEEEKGKVEKSLDTYVYTNAEDKYKDNVSTAWTFLVFGLLAFVFCLLHYFGVLGIMAGGFQQGVALVLSIGFILYGLYSFTRSKALAEAIQKEADAKKRYMDWFRTLTEEDLNAVKSAEASEEENEILLVNYLSERLTKEFPEINANFADALADEYFKELFD